MELIVFTELNGVLWGEVNSTAPASDSDENRSPLEFTVILLNTTGSPADGDNDDAVCNLYRNDLVPSVYSATPENPNDVSLDTAYIVPPLVRRIPTFGKLPLEVSKT